MTRPLALLGALADRTTELKAGEILEASADGTCTYTLDDQDDRIRGPARYLRPGSPSGAAAGPDSHAHARPAPPPQGTPCLVVTIGGEFASVWVIPFE